MSLSRTPLVPTPEPVMHSELLELDVSGIHVAEYLTSLPPREVLQAKLHEAIVRSRARLESRGEEA